MAYATVSTALITCTFGAAPTSLTVLPTSGVQGPTPVGDIMSYIPMSNIPTFGMCSSPSNPTVIAATAAALGVLTPMPCVPMTVAPWIPGAPTVLTGSMPTLTNSCKLLCTWAGSISITYAGQVATSVSG